MDRHDAWLRSCEWNRQHFQSSGINPGYDNEWHWCMMASRCNSQASCRLFGLLLSWSLMLQRLHTARIHDFFFFSFHIILDAQGYVLFMTAWHTRTVVVWLCVVFSRLVHIFGFPTKTNYNTRQTSVFHKYIARQWLTVYSWLLSYCEALGFLKGEWR